MVESKSLLSLLNLVFIALFCFIGSLGAMEFTRMNQCRKKVLGISQVQRSANNPGGQTQNTNSYGQAATANNNSGNFTNQTQDESSLGGGYGNYSS